MKFWKTIRNWSLSIFRIYINCWHNIVVHTFGDSWEHVRVAYKKYGCNFKAELSKILRSKFSYNVKDAESCKQQSYCDEDRQSQYKMISNLLWRKVKQANDTVVRNCNAIWFIMWINDLVPDVGYPHTWNQKCKQDK